MGVLYPNILSNIMYNENQFSLRRLTVVTQRKCATFIVLHRITCHNICVIRKKKPFSLYLPSYMQAVKAPCSFFRACFMLTPKEFLVIQYCNCHSRSRINTVLHCLNRNCRNCFCEETRIEISYEVHIGT